MTSTSFRVLPAVAGAVLAVVGLLAGCGATPAEEPVTDWITRTAVPLDGVVPGPEPADLAPLARSIGDARIVGLGESTHGVAEEITLKHRVLRLLVEQLGFRSVAWEEDWTLGLEINDYLRTGSGTVEELVSRMSPQWQSREVTDVLRWLRAFNSDRADQVQFVGVEYYATPAQAYDTLDTYVGRVAPERMPALRDHLAAIRPTGTNIYEHIQRYAGVPDKRSYVDHAQQVHDIVDGLPHGPADREHQLAVHTAAQIVSFHRHYQLSDADGLGYRDEHAAENVRWWTELTGDRTVYWAASPHTANAPQLRISGPPGPDMRFASAGSHLRRWYGPQYRSIGCTVGHGAANLGPGQDAVLPEPGPDRFERPLSDAGLTTFALDLRAPAPPAVREWLDSPATFRGLPDHGPDGVIDGGAPAEWFDVIVHHQDATPTTPAT
jgi:erythromycin esterase